MSRFFFSSISLNVKKLPLKRLTAKPATIPQKKHDIILMATTLLPNAPEYIMSCGLRRIELIIKAAKGPSLTPLFEREVTIGIVPYIHSGDAIPNKDEINSAITPSENLPVDSTAFTIHFLKKTEITEPIITPNK